MRQFLPPFYGDNRSECPTITFAEYAARNPTVLKLPEHRIALGYALGFLRRSSFGKLEDFGLSEGVEITRLTQPTETG